jgi:hypothetical protein
LKVFYLIALVGLSGLLKLAALPNTRNIINKGRFSVHASFKLHSEENSTQLETIATKNEENREEQKHDDENQQQNRRSIR